MKVDLSERLFNLTCALLASSRGLTKQEIFSSVQGYKEDFDPHGDKTAIDRQFDRDKNLLLANGVNLKSFIPIDAMDDNGEFVYQIPKDTVRWPSNIVFTARQLALLNLASQMWAKASLSSETTRGVMRLRALGESPEESNLIGVAPLILTKEASFAPLSDAIDRTDVVKFEYRKAGTYKAEVRTVQPWALQLVAGNWLLVSFDENRKEVRSFLLKRIVSKVATVGKKFERPKYELVESALDELKELTDSQVASLRIKPDSDAWFHYEVEESILNEQGELEINYMDLHLLADELREFIFDLESVRPSELKDAIDLGFEKVVNEHHA